jgi:hypothetical protein
MVVTRGSWYRRAWRPDVGSMFGQGMNPQVMAALIGESLRANPVRVTRPVASVQIMRSATSSVSGGRLGVPRGPDGSSASTARSRRGGEIAGPRPGPYLNGSSNVWDGDALRASSFEAPDGATITA